MLETWMSQYRDALDAAVSVNDMQAVKIYARLLARVGFAALMEVSTGPASDWRLGHEPRD